MKNKYLGTALMISFNDGRQSIISERVTYKH